jgi:hypothetical protein
MFRLKKCRSIKNLKQINFLGRPGYCLWQQNQRKNRSRTKPKTRKKKPADFSSFGKKQFCEFFRRNPIFKNLFRGP